MDNVFDVNIIPTILELFKVKNIVISGQLDDSCILEIDNYCDNNDGSIEINILEDYSLNALSNLKNYDVIFLNDDPNWFTVFNKLNIINENNTDFPLVFVCHNIFPHKWRDSYIDPTIIPMEFLNDYSETLFVDGISIHDGYFHAVDENTSKNGVETAINDFISQNVDIELMDIKLLNGFVILYKNHTINQIRLTNLHRILGDNAFNYSELHDDIVQNQLLKKYIKDFNIPKNGKYLSDDLRVELDKKDKIIDEFKSQIEVYDYELNYNNSRIEQFESNLDLKDAQIKDFKAKLTNKNNLLRETEEELDSKNNLLRETEEELDSKNNLLRETEEELKYKDECIEDIKKEYLSQLSKLDTFEYYFCCFEEIICNNLFEIQYLKNRVFIKKLLNPFAYVVLLFKSNPKDLILNFKLYNAIKNSKCFDVGYYLNNNEDIQNSAWCNYFSPELHYVCFGFDEKRKFNKKFFNRKSKKHLLNYILNFH